MTLFFSLISLLQTHLHTLMRMFPSRHTEGKAKVNRYVHGHCRATHLQLLDLCIRLFGRDFVLTVLLHDQKRNNNVKGTCEVSVSTYASARGWSLSHAPFSAVYFRFVLPLLMSSVKSDVWTLSVFCPILWNGKPTSMYEGRPNRPQFWRANAQRLLILGDLPVVLSCFSLSRRPARGETFNPS